MRVGRYTFGVNKTGLVAKISIKYVLPTCMWKYFWRISRYFAFFWESRGISRKYLNFAGPRPREISEAPQRLFKRTLYKCTTIILLLSCLVLSIITPTLECSTFLCTFLFPLSYNLHFILNILLILSLLS